MENLEAKLKELPLYSLTSEQKECVLDKIMSERRKKKRKLFIRPLLALPILLFLCFGIFQLNKGQILLSPLSSKVQLTSTKATTFTLPSYNQEVFGIEGKIGILNGGPFIAGDTTRGAKTMLFLWGEQSELVGKSFSIEAKNEQNEKVILADGVLTTPLYDEDAHTLTSFESLPTVGVWQLTVTVEQQLFEQFTVDVMRPFMETDHFTILLSPDEILVGAAQTVMIESTQVKESSIPVRLLNSKGQIVSNSLFTQEHQFIQASTGKELYAYEGELTIPQQGKWIIEVNGEQVTVKIE